MADSSALRLVTPCTNLAEFVLTYRGSADAGAITVEVAAAPPSVAGPCRVVVALANRATVLDGDASFERGADGQVTVRFARLDVRSRGLLQHLVDARRAEAIGAIPRHLVPLGAPVGDPASARPSPAPASCTFEPMGPRPGEPPRKAMPALPTLRGRPSTAPPPAAAAAPAPAAPVIAAPAPVIAAPPPAPVIAAPAPAAPVIAAPVVDPPSAPAAKPRRRRESQPTLLGVTAPRTVEPDTDPRRPIPAAVTRAEPDFESTLHGPAPVRVPGDFTTPDLVAPPVDPPRAARTRRGPAVALDHDTGESDAAPGADDLVTDVALALPDDLGDDVDPLAEPPAPASMPPRGVAMAVSKASAMPRAVAHGHGGPLGLADVGVTAPMAAPPAAMLEAHPSAAVVVAASAASTAPMTAPIGKPPAIAAAPAATATTSRRTPAHGAPPVAAPPTPAPGAVPIVAPPPVVSRPTPAPGSVPVVSRPTPAPGSVPVVSRPTPAPGSVPVVSRPTPAPGSVPVMAPAPSAPPVMAQGTGAAPVPHPAAWPTPAWSPPPAPAAPAYPPAAAYPAAAPPPSYPTAQVRALDAPAAQSASWQRHRAAMREDGGDMTEIITVPRVRRRRWPVIAITSAVVVVIAIAIIALTSGGASSSSPTPKSPTPPAPTPAPAPKREAPAEPPAAPAAAPKAEIPPAPPVAPAPPAAAAAASAAACRVAFTSSPDGADVTVDGRPLGATPVTIDVPCDARRVTFHRDRYQDHAEPLALRPGEQAITARLERPTFTVTVASRPAGAAVTLGGRSVGKTPVKLSVPGFEGTPVELALPGFQPHRERVYATKAGQRFDIRLKRR